MKKLLALLPLIGAFALCGCGGEKESEGGKGEKLPYTEEQVRSNVKNLGETMDMKLLARFLLLAWTKNNLIQLDVKAISSGTL